MKLGRNGKSRQNHKLSAHPAFAPVMGLWGAAQAIAFGLGGVVGTAALDLSRIALGGAQPAYAAVFLLIALMFAAAAWLGARIGAVPLPPTPAFARHAAGD